MSQSFKINMNFNMTAVLREEDKVELENTLQKIKAGEFDDDPAISHLKNLEGEEFLLGLVKANIRGFYKDIIQAGLNNGGFIKISPIKIEIEPKGKTDGESEAA